MKHSHLWERILDHLGLAAGDLRSVSPVRVQDRARVAVSQQKQIWMLEAIASGLPIALGLRSHLGPGL